MEDEVQGYQEEGLHGEANGDGAAPRHARLFRRRRDVEAGQDR
jgi:hypothetical protein